MGLRAIGVVFIILSLNASAVMMAESGMNDHMGVQPTGGWSDTVNQFDKSQSEISSGGAGFDDYVGFTVTSVQYLLDAFILLGPTASAFRAAMFPRWMVDPLMLVVRVTYWIGVVQVIRGVLLE